MIDLCFVSELFLVSLLTMTCVTVFIVVYLPPFFADFFELKTAGIPISFRILMVILALAHFFLAILCEV